MELIRRDTDYAVRALLAIARADGFIQAVEIVRSEDVPFDFIQKILRRLKNAGILKARRGSGGGFSLARPAQDITLKSVLEAVQGPVAANRCFLEKEKCKRQDKCPVRKKLAGLQESINELLDAVTIREILEKEDS